MQRYTIAPSKAQKDEAEQYDIMDYFSGKTVQDGLSPESADETCARMNERFAEAAKLAEQVSRFVNGMDSRAPGEFVAAMGREHRTLQQGFTRMMVAWIERLAKLEKQPGEYDLRNEGSVLLAKQIVATPGWEDRKYLPYI